MTGRLLRKGPHRCAPPTFGAPGDVWMCDCRRRWTATLDVREPGGIDWRRRVWPWPRPADTGHDPIPAETLERELGEARS